VTAIATTLDRRLAQTVAVTERWKLRHAHRPITARAAGVVDFFARGTFWAWRNRRYLTARKLANMALVNVEFLLKREKLLSRPYAMKIESTNICNTKCQLCPTGIGLRKGLPYSIELQLKGRWIGVSRQGTIGGGVRAAILEGKRGWPDLGVHLEYTGYVGNRELRMGVLDVGLSLGGTAMAGKEGTKRTARIQPWVDVSLLAVSAAPLVPANDAALLGAVAYGRRSPDPEGIPTDKMLLMPRFTGGLQLDAPQFLVRLTGGYTLNAIAHAGVAIGFRR